MNSSSSHQQPFLLPLSFAKRLPAVLTLPIVVLISLATPAKCQTTIGLDRLNGSYTTGFDNIDLGSLAVHIDIPLFTQKVLGKGTDLVLKMTYDSAQSGLLNVGWTIGAPPSGSLTSYLSADIACYPEPQPGNNPINHHYGWYYRDSDGVVHVYDGETITSECNEPQTSLNELPTDGAPYRLKADGINGTVTLPSGMIVAQGDFPLYWDSNGNLGSSYHYPTESGPSGSTRPPLLFPYKDSTGATQTITVSYVSYSVSSGLNYSGPIVPDCVQHIPPPYGLVDRITFPDNSYYSFTYEDSTTCPGAKTGRLATMRLPTGGEISYVYPIYMAYIDPGSFSTLRRTGPDGTTEYERVLTGTESNGLPRTWTTKIRKLHSGSTPSDLTEITFVGGAAHRGIETGRKVYQGSGGTPILETHRCYNGATGDCTNQLFYLPVTQVDEKRSMNGGPPARTKTSYNFAHLETEVDEYDFGGSSVLRKTKTLYASLGNNIADRPWNITITDANDVKLKETIFSYDDYPLVAPNGATANRSDVIGDRGNLTQKRDWTGSGSTYIGTSYHYDEAGQVVSTTDGRGYSTSYLYDDATDAVAKQITRPATGNNTIQHVTRIAVNSNTLMPDAITDENSIRTEYSYDSMLRLTTTETAVGKAGEERRQTTSYPNTTQIKSSQDKDTKDDQVIVSRVTTDSYGRILQTTQVSAGNVSVDTIYDEVGRVQAQSTPHSGTVASGWTSYQFDALGRVQSQCQPDNGATYTTCDSTATGGVVITSYDEATVAVTDESGHSRKLVTDALGRLTDVYEDPGGANLHTSYAYDLLDNLRSVSQLGTSQSGNQDHEETRTLRSYNYDSLSRLICSSNPENATAQCPTAPNATYTAGTIGYSYDPNGDVTLKTDARGATVAYSYDELNRLTSKTATGGSSGIMYACYSYDVGPVGSENFVGRLAKESTQTAPCTASAPASGTMRTQRSIQTYNAIGQIRAEQRCVLVSCTNLTHDFDLASNLTKYDTGIDALSITNHFDMGGRLDNVSSSAFDGTLYHPQSLYNVTTFHPTGAATAFDLGVTTSVSTTFDQRLRPTGLTAKTK